MAAGLDDHLLGVTHIIRGKEPPHELGFVQEFMYKRLGWELPDSNSLWQTQDYWAFLSKSKNHSRVNERIYSGFDDPRLATFAAIRKRGITAAAIKKMIIDVGP